MISAALTRPRPFVSALLVLGVLVALVMGVLGTVSTASATPKGTLVQQVDKPKPPKARTISPNRVKLSGLSNVSAGGEHTCGIQGAGSLWCWGRNSYGQIGNGKIELNPVAPTQIGAATEWTQVSGGGANTCAITSLGAMWCWGLNNRGQLGDGTTKVSTVPKKVPGPAGWASVSTAWFHTCGIKTDQSLWCWGDNANGQLGRGNTKRTTKRAQVAGKWTSVAVGGWSTCAVNVNGGLYCWGRNTFGQLGQGHERDLSRPTRVGAGAAWKSISMSWTHACGQFADAAFCWGRNNNGQLGNGNTETARVPQRVVGNHKALSVTAAEGTSCLVDEGNKLWCWGDNRYAQIGGSTLSVTSPVNRAGDYTSVGGGWLHVCAAATSGADICWGNNERGQLGNGEAHARPVARQLSDVPPASRRKKSLSFRLASMNALGNGHSRAYAHDDHFGPSRMRAEWTAQALINNGIDVVGLQEPDAGQLSGILRAANGRYVAYPGPHKGDLGVETTILWDTTKFEAVKRSTMVNQFIARNLKRPIVRLREKASGREFWVVNIHNAPRAYQDKRNKAVKVQLAKIKQLEATNIPVFYIGDFNEKATILCKVLRQTGLVTPKGGRLTKQGKCVTPKSMRVDWIFGSKSVKWTGFAYTKPPLARLATDHWVPVVNVQVP